jgi:DNA-directed RNA polymerase specialized sigma subunit
LVRAAQEGDRDAQQLLFKRLRRSVEGLARRYAKTVSAEDLVQDGFIEVLKALSRFDPRRSVPFWGFARPSVERAIKRSSRGRRVITLSVRDAAQIAVLYAVKDALRARFGAEPSVAELAAELGLSTRQVVELQKQANTVLSLDELVEQADERDQGANGVADRDEVESQPIAEEPYPDPSEAAQADTWAPPDVKKLLRLYGHLRARVSGSRRELGENSGAAQSARPGSWLQAWLVDLKCALERMPKREYAVVELVGLQDLPAKEAASRLGVSERTVYNRWKAGAEWLCAFLNDPDHQLPAERVMHLLHLPDALADCVDRHPTVFQRATELEYSGKGEGLEVRWIAGDGWWVSVLAKDHEPDPARSLLEVLVEAPAQ